MANVDKEERARREGYLEGVRQCYLLGNIKAILAHLHELQQEALYLGEKEMKGARHDPSIKVRKGVL